MNSPAGASEPSGESERDGYRRRLRALQVELVKLQRFVIEQELRLLVIVEGRDAAGKDGAIKRFVQHLSPRETRVHAPAKPSERERASWYFQRFIPHLPAAGEIVLFNRSWYNRCGVERVMGYCSAGEAEDFLEQAPAFERLLADSPMKLIKIYLDVSHAEQKRRLEARRDDPLKQWKISPVDARATELWDDYSAARDEMLSRSHSEWAPWTIVKADRKKKARLGLIAHVLERVPFAGRDQSLARTDSELVFLFSPACLRDGRLAP